MNNDLCWLAGLVEGEGCFDKKGSAPRFQINMNDRDVVDRAAAVIRSLVTTKANVCGPYGGKKYNENAAGYYAFAVQNQPAEDLMRILHPLLGARRRAKIEEIFDALELDALSS